MMLPQFNSHPMTPDFTEASLVSSFCSMLLGLTSFLRGVQGNVSLTVVCSNCHAPSTAVADAIRTSLGPKGMDKMVSGPVASGELLLLILTT